MYWLIVERPENWEADRKNLFKHFGVPESKHKMASQVSEGDKLIVYISGGVSCFSDIRLVNSDELIRLRGLTDYDDVFPYAIKTQPYMTLPREHWVTVKDLASRLAFTKSLKDWRQVFRSSMRKLDDVDGEFLENVMQKIITQAGQDKK